MSNIPDTSQFLLRWTIGRQNTVAMADYQENKFAAMIELTRLSISSFQKWFPESRCVLLYNGDNFSQFQRIFDETEPALLRPIEIVNQVEKISEWGNPYHFWPCGVWWKWVPFRIDVGMHEIAIDTDIICLDRPQTWYDWIESGKPLMIAPERFEVVKVNTCGDLWMHPVIQGKKPFNCGVVGQRAGHDYESRFFDITKAVRAGETHDSMFITEQGVVNVWIRSLEMEGVGHYCLDFQKNAWMRDFLFFLLNGIRVETIHAVTWHKEIVKSLSEIFRRRIFDDGYLPESFTSDLLIMGKTMDVFSRSVLARQLGDASHLDSEILIPGR